jgi:lysophospholipase L1-like esterase
MKKLRIILIASLIFNFLGLAFFTFLYDKALFWRSERDYLRELILEKDTIKIVSNHIDIKRIVFLGDSRTAMFPLSSFFPKTVFCLNMGVIGDNMTEIRKRYFNLITPDEHDILVIQGGINDILDGVNRKGDEDKLPQRILNEYDRIVSKELSANKSPVVMSILPVTNRFLLTRFMSVTLPTDFDVTKINRIIVDTNNKLKELCSEKMIRYVDAHSKVLNGEGQFLRRYAKTDGYHVNTFGYEIIAKEIQHVLKM